MSGPINDVFKLTQCSEKYKHVQWKDYLTDEIMLLDSFSLDRFGT